MTNDDRTLLRYRLHRLKEHSASEYNALLSDVLHDAADTSPEIEADVATLREIKGLGRSGALQILFALGLLFEESESGGIVSSE